MKAPKHGGLQLFKVLMEWRNVVMEEWSDGVME
jgi:hypothetical protein